MSNLPKCSTAYPAQLWELCNLAPLCCICIPCSALHRAGAAIRGTVQPVKAQGVISTAEWLRQSNKWSSMMAIRILLPRIHEALC